MDSLVARYSRPATLQREAIDEDQHDELANEMGPNLSLKFAMPPVAQVSFFFSYVPSPRYEHFDSDGIPLLDP